jgi:hypothetical protein
MDRAFVGSSCDYHELGESNKMQWRRDRKIGNYPGGQVLLDASETISSIPDLDQGPDSELSEADVKRKVEAWLGASGWQVQVIWGRGRGIDIEAQRDGQRWVIEAKDCGSLDAMRVNYFLAILGELLQRMSDPDARYSLALPDLKQFRGCPITAHVPLFFPRRGYSHGEATRLVRLHGREKLFPGASIEAGILLPNYDSGTSISDRLQDCDKA